MTVGMRKTDKKVATSKSLFTPVISKTLAERQRELSNGGGLEVRDISELKKRVRRKSAATK